VHEALSYSQVIAAGEFVQMYAKDIELERDRKKTVGGRGGFATDTEVSALKLLMYEALRGGFATDTAVSALKLLMYEALRGGFATDTEVSAYY
jgi:hypothetical protein